MRKSLDFSIARVLIADRKFSSFLKLSRNLHGRNISNIRMGKQGNGLAVQEVQGEDVSYISIRTDRGAACFSATIRGGGSLAG